MPARTKKKKSNDTNAPQSQAPLHRREYASKYQDFTPHYTHLSPCATAEPPTLLFPSGSTALYSCENASSRLQAPLESDLLTAIALTPSADHAILAHRSAHVRIHELPPANPPSAPRSFRPFNNSNVVAFISVHPSGEYAAFSSADGSIRVHNMSNLALTHTLSSNVVTTTLAFPPSVDATDLIVGCDDGSIRLFNLLTKSNSPALVVRPHIARVTSLVFPTPSSLASTSLDAVLAVHSYATGEITETKLISHSDPIITALALPDGRVVTASRKPCLRVWNVSRRTEVLAAGLNLPFVRSTSNSGDEDDEDDAVTVIHAVRTREGIMIALTDQTILTVVAKSGAPLQLARRVLCGNLEEIYDVRFLPSNESDENNNDVPSVVVASNSPILWVLRPPGTASHSQWACSAALRAHTGNILAVDAVAGGGVSYVLSASRDRTARLWCQYPSGRGDMSKISGRWACVAVAEGHADAVSAVALPSRVIAGRFFMVTAAADRTIKLWSLEAVRRAVGKGEGRTASAEAESSQDAECSIVDVSTDYEGVTALSANWTILAHAKDVNTVAISPDGSMIASGSQDRLLKLWLAEGGRLHMTCEGHRRGIWSVAFSSVDRVVASASGDCTLRIWSVQNGSCLRTLQGHMSGVLRAMFVSRGTQVASCGADGLFKVWTTRSGECDSTVDAHEDRVWGLDVANDGGLVVSGGADGRVALWNDCSADVENARAKRKEEEAQMMQVVDSAARACEWSVAAIGALELGMTQKLKSIVSEIVISSSFPEQEMVKMVKGIFEGNGGLDEDSRMKKQKQGDNDIDDENQEEIDGDSKRWSRIGKLFTCCRDWNASGGAKSASVASYLLQALFGVWGVDELCDKLKVEKRSLVEALDAHCGRHVERVNQLTTRVAILESTLTNMRSVLDAPAHNMKRKKSLGKNIQNDGGLKRKRKSREDVDCEY